MKIRITQSFKKLAKKLHQNQKDALKEAIVNVEQNPLLGDSKVGDLAGLRVYKFHMTNQLTLLAYLYSYEQDEIILVYFASHENFYKNVKLQLKSLSLN